MGSECAGVQFVVSLEATPIPTWVYDRAASAIVAVNEAALRALGVSRAEILDSTLASLCPDPRAVAAEMSRAVAETRRATWHQRGQGGQLLEIEAAVTPQSLADRPAWLIQATRIAPVASPRRSQEMLERVEAVLEHAAVGLSLSTAEGVVEYVSPAVERILGFRPEELTGQRASVHSHPDDVQEMKPVHDALARQSGASHVFLSRVTTKAGAARWIESTVTNLLHEPSVGAIATHFRDVTDRESSRRALADTSRRFESLLSATSAITYTCAVEPPFGATFISDNVTSVLGYTATEFLDEPGFWAERIHPDERDTILAGVARVFHEGRHVHEYRFRHADGSYRWMHDDLALVRDEHGSPRELIGCLFDVTARREAELAIRRSELNFRALIEGLPVAVIVHRDDKVLYANAAMVALLGYDSPGDLVGRSPFSYVAPANREAARARATKLVLEPGIARTPLAEGAMIRRDGTHVDVEVEGLKLDFDGAPASVVLARDLTESRAILARISVADRLASVGTLAAGVAHEINNPLAYVMTNLAIVSESVPALLGGAERTPAAKVEMLLRDAYEGATRIQSLVNDLRVLAHPDRDTTRSLDLRTVIETCVRMAQNEIRHRARLVTHFGDVPQIAGNPSRLSQVVLNLLINAAQAIPEGDVANNEIRVSLRRAAPGGVVIEVADTGCGIPDAIVGRIFDPFFTTKPMGRGTGLGLAICHGIVKAMEGEISVETRAPHGTTFKVSLPVSEESCSDREPERLVQPLERMRVLIVDDEPSICRSLEILWSDVHDVVSMTRAKEALARLSMGESFDVVLCDLMMAEMNGMQFYETLRAEKPQLARRVLFLTGGAFTPASREFLARVPNLRIEKPFDLFALNDAMRATRSRADAAESAAER